MLWSVYDELLYEYFAACGREFENMISPPPLRQHFNFFPEKLEILKFLNFFNVFTKSEIDVKQFSDRSEREILCVFSKFERVVELYESSRNLFYHEYFELE